METNAGLELLDQTRIVAIVRGVPADKIVPVGQALYDGGIRVMEVTLNTSGAAGMISALRESLGDRMWIGAGTVLDEDDLATAAEAGAQFIVTPNMEEKVIAESVARGLPIYPGCMTPTEIVKAWKAGATAVKLFPSASLGLAYVKELQGPLSHIPMMAVGGVTPDNIGSFFDAGCVAVGIGSALINHGEIARNEWERVTARAAAFTEAVARYRERGAAGA